jgi:hypothetical protein
MTDNPDAPRHWSWRIKALDDAYRFARESFGGPLYVLLLTVGVIAQSLAILNSGKPLGGEEYGAIAGMAAQVGVVGFCAYRIRAGKGWIAGPIMLVLLAVDIVDGMTQRSWLWAALYSVAFVSSVVGVAACWQIRQRLQRGETRSDTTGPH